MRAAPGSNVATDRSGEEPALLPREADGRLLGIGEESQPLQPARRTPVVEGPADVPPVPLVVAVCVLQPVHRRPVVGGLHRQRPVRDAAQRALLRKVCADARAGREAVAELLFFVPSSVVGCHTAGQRLERVESDSAAKTALNVIAETKAFLDVNVVVNCPNGEEVVTIARLDTAANTMML